MSREVRFVKRRLPSEAYAWTESYEMPPSCADRLFLAFKFWFSHAIFHFHRQNQVTTMYNFGSLGWPDLFSYYLVLFLLFV